MILQLGPAIYPDISRAELAADARRGTRGSSRPMPNVTWAKQMRPSARSI